MDADDLHDGNHRLDLLFELKHANPLFKITVFAIPALCSEEFLSSLPDWIETAAHGWAHPTPTEAADWTYDTAVAVLSDAPLRLHGGWKSPGWQISEGTYRALLERNWWLADQPYNDWRRPQGIRVHRLGDGDHSHHHIQDDCGNGLEESMEWLLPRVHAADHFQFISEVVQAWS